MRRAALPQVPQRVEAGQADAGRDRQRCAARHGESRRKGRAEALAPVNPGDGVLAAGGDSDPAHSDAARRRTTARHRLAAFACAGVARVTVREPRMRVVPLRGSGMIAAAARWSRATSSAAAARRSWTKPAAISTACWRRKAPTPSSRSAAPAAAATTPACARWRARAASPCTAWRSRPAKPPRSDLSDDGRCCCCRAGSMPRWRSG